jgi:meso-butanediol dehydrogenase/(S,S)-butanediol dehydrogenase/diacetyl reductase
MKRLVTVDDVAAAAAFLSSDDAAMITGVMLPVDGGMTAR